MTVVLLTAMGAGGSAYNKLSETEIIIKKKNSHGVLSQDWQY